MRRAFTIVEFIVTLAIIGILTVILLPANSRSSCGNYRLTDCQSHLKQIGLGVLQYVQDHDEKFPPTQTNTKIIWANSLQPYVKSWQVFHCPSAEIVPKPNVHLRQIVGYTTDYFYNERLATLNQTKLAAPQNTIMGGDGSADAFSNSAISMLPIGWVKATSSPSRRHTVRKTLGDRILKRNFDRANYLFADGHVKFAIPEKITLDTPKASGNYTFIPL